MAPHFGNETISKILFHTHLYKHFGFIKIRPSMKIDEMATRMFGTPSERKERDRKASLKDAVAWKPRFYAPMLNEVERAGFIRDELKPLILLLLREQFPHESIDELKKKAKNLFDEESKGEIDRIYEKQFKANRQQTEDEVEQWKLQTKIATEMFQLDINGKFFDFVETEIPGTNIKYDLSELLFRHWGIRGKTPDEIRYDLHKWDGHVEKVRALTKDRHELGQFFVKFVIRRP